MDILLYIMIFCAKIIEVSLMTLRIVFITKGERKMGALVAFFEVSIWLFLVTTVLGGITEDPLKAVVYALGFAVGNFVGSLLEERIGLGLSQVQIIVKADHGIELATAIRKEGYACTLVQGEGVNFERYILFMYVKRKRVSHLLDVAKKNQENAVITVMETKPLHGGFGIRK